MKNGTLNKDLYPLLNIVKFVLAIFIIAVHTWFLIDLDDVVVHIFVGDERRRYNLDGMYGDNPILVVE